MKYFYKPLSLTSNEFIFNLKKENKITNKACYCGRLDPMARGKMLILENEECKKMLEYLNNSKYYEFIIVFGISTDTDDIMGLFENASFFTDFSLLKQKKIYKDKIKKAIQKIQCKKFQKYHKYSSFVLRKEGKRKPLWEWEKSGQLRENEIPSKKVKIYELKELDKYELNLINLIKIWIQLISNVNKRHNFRQEEIIQQYKTLIQQEKKAKKENKINKENIKVLCVKYKIKVSSGFYVRQFICDLKREIGFPLLVYDINRVEISQFN